MRSSEPMDRQRGLSPAAGQPRLPGLGVGLGAGAAAAGRQKQKPGLPLPSPGLATSGLRPGSLSSSSRLGSTGIGGGLGALPLRSVGRHSLDPNWVPSAAGAASAAARDSRGGGAAASTAATAPDCNGTTAASPPDATAFSPEAVGAPPSGDAGRLQAGPEGTTTQGPPAKHSDQAPTASTPAEARRLGALLDGGGIGSSLAIGPCVSRPQQQQQQHPPPRRRQSAPAAGLPRVSGVGAGGGGGAAAGLPLRSHLPFANGGTPGATSNGVSGGAAADAFASGKPPPTPQPTPQPRAHIQWLPPVPAKADPGSAGAPKPAKQRTRPVKQVQWLLPEKELLKEKQEQLQLQQLQQLQQQQQQASKFVDGAWPQRGPPLKRQRLEAAAPTPGVRLGGLRQPALTSPSPPPLQALSYNFTGGAVAPGSAAQHLRSLTPGGRGGQRREDEGLATGSGSGSGSGTGSAHAPVACLATRVPDLAALTAADWARLQRCLQGGSGGARLHEALNALTVYSFSAPQPPQLLQPSQSLLSPLNLQPPEQPQNPQQQQQQQQESKEEAQEAKPAAVAAEGTGGGEGPQGPVLAAAGVGAGQDGNIPAAAVGATAAARHGCPDPGLEPSSREPAAAAAAVAETGGRESPARAGAAAGASPPVVETQPQSTAVYGDLQAALRAHPGVVRALWQLVRLALRPGDDEVYGNGGAAAASSPPQPARRSELRRLDGSTSADGGAHGGDVAMTNVAAPAAGAGPCCGPGGTADTAQQPGPAQRRDQQRRETGGGGDGPKAPEGSGPGQAAGGEGAGGGGATRALEPQELSTAAAAAAQRLAWGACAAGVLRNLAAAEVAPEQLLCDVGLEACAAALESTLPPAAAGPRSTAGAVMTAAAAATRSRHRHDLVAAVLELLAALPHRLRLPAPPEGLGDGEGAGVVDTVGLVAVPQQRPSPQKSGCAAPPLKQAQEEEEDGRREQPAPWPAADRPLGQCQQQWQQVPAPASASRGSSLSVRPLLQGVVQVMVGSPGLDVPIRLRTLAAGLLAAWLAIPANRPAVVHALAPPSQPDLPTPAFSVTPGDGGGAHHRGCLAAPPGAAAATPLPGASSQPHGGSRPPLHWEPAAAGAGGVAAQLPLPPGSKGPGAVGEPLADAEAVAGTKVAAPPVKGAEEKEVERGMGPLRGLEALLGLDAAEAEADARRELSATSATTATTTTTMTTARADKVTRVLAAWRRSDAAAAAVEVLQGLACACGPAGRRLLASHRGDLLRSLAELAACRPAQGALPPQGAGAAAYGSNPLKARCRAALAAAAEVAAEVLEALACGSASTGTAAAMEAQPASGGGGPSAMEVDPPA